MPTPILKATAVALVALVCAVRGTLAEERIGYIWCFLNDDTHKEAFYSELFPGEWSRLNTYSAEFRQRVIERHRACADFPATCEFLQSFDEGRARLQASTRRSRLFGYDVVATGWRP